MNLSPALAFVLLLAVQPAAQATQWWSQGDPTPDEQATLEWINHARADPVGLLQALMADEPSDPVLSAFFAAQIPLTASNLVANLTSAVVIAQQNSAAFPRSSAISTAPLAFYPLFIAHARASAQQATLSPPVFPSGRTPPAYYPPIPFSQTLLSGPNNTFSGPDATGGTATFGPYGGTYSDLTQADLYASALTGREFVLTWLCAPGSGSPPPAFLSQGDALPDLTLGHTRMAGIGLASPATDGSRSLAFYRASSEFITQSDLPFGAAGTVFITGVVYRDQNANGVYDAGEGIPGVTITTDQGPWGAVTASAGGYAIPVPANSGTYHLTATGGPFATAPATATANVAEDSVKIDWVLPPQDPPLPTQTTVPATSGSVQLVNLSTRGLVETGPNALAGGFVIAGPPGATKRLLIRGVGPSLQSSGLTADQVVPATQLQIYSGSTLIASNTGWLTAPDGGAAAAQAAAQSGAFPLTAWAGGGGDSALTIALPPGLYSAVVTPAPGAPAADLSGHIGLIELYDLSPADGSQLVNLSSRGLAEAGSGALVVGATVAGSGTQRLLWRAAGPSLTAFGVAGALPDPVLTLYDQSGAPLASNDDWSSSPQTDQIQSLAAAVGAFPLPWGSADSALIAGLAAGSYSAIVSSHPGSALSGVALVEIYSAP